MPGMPTRRRPPRRAYTPYDIQVERAARRAPAPADLEEAVRRRVGWLMMPLRLFLGLTFVYAGLVKLLDPTFLDGTSAASLVSQLHGFARTSPLQPLIDGIALRFPKEVGLAIALGELGAGLGALTGLLVPLAAWVGFGISVLLWLTASWSTAPYFLGPDLPYAAGWLTLALVGDGGLLVLRGFASRYAEEDEATDGATATPPARVLSRRWFLEGIALGVGALVIGGDAYVWGHHGLGDDESLARNGTATLPPTGLGGGAANGAGTGAGGSSAIGDLTSLHQAGSLTFTVPSSGDPGVLIQLPGGKIVAFDAVCTHAGCTVEYVPQDKALECPCHGAAFDPANAGAVLGGPTGQPLQELPIKVDQATGQITLTS